MYAIRFIRLSGLPGLILSFLFFLNTCFAGDSNDCLDPVWKLPKGEYIKQICRDHATPDDGCPSTMNYDSESELLTINYVQNHNHFIFNINKPCSYVQDGLQLRVTKKMMIDMNGKPVDILRFQADSKDAARKTPLEDLKEDDEPAIVKLATRGQLTKTCNLDYYSPAGILAGRCKSGGDFGEVPSDDKVIAVSYLNWWSRWFLKHEDKIMDYVPDLKNKMERIQSKKEVWFYQLKLWLRKLGFNLVQDVEEELIYFKEAFSKVGLDPDHPGFLGYALRNIDGILEFQRCIDSFETAIGCRTESYFETGYRTYPDHLQRYCKCKGLETVLIQGVLFCHDPRYKNENIKIERCPNKNIAVDSRTGLLVAECKGKPGQSTFRFMDNALSCLNNHKEGARLYTAVLRVSHGVLF